MNAEKLIFILALPLAAHAEDLTVAVPQTELDVSSHRSVLSPSPPQGQAVFQISSWSAKDYAAPSNVAGASAYTAAGAPELSAAYVWKLTELRHGGALYYRAGASYSHMSRQAMQPELSTTQFTGQTLHLIPLRAGVEWHPNWIRSRTFMPYLGAALLPAVAIATKSSLGGSGASFGVPGEVSAGATVNVPKLSTASSLDLSVIYRAGKLDDVDFTGLGVQAGLRFEI